MGTNGDYWGLNFMGNTGKTIDVIPKSPKVVITSPGPYNTKVFVIFNVLR